MDTPRRLLHRFKSLAPRCARFVAAFALCAAARTGLAQAAGEETIAVLPLEISGGIVASRQALEAAVGRGVAAAGRPVVFTEDVSTRLAGRAELTSCQTPACWIEAGKALGAGHLCRGEVQRGGREFRVRFELIAAATGRSVGIEQGRCDEDDCSVGELARRTAASLVRAAAAPPVAPPPAAPSPPETLRPALIAEPAQARAAPARGRTWLPLALVGAGVAAVATGVTLIVLDGCTERLPTKGDPSKRICVTAREHDLLLPGIAAAGAGAALGVAGVALHLRRPTADRVSLSAAVGPTGFALRGRF